MKNDSLEPTQIKTSTKSTIFSSMKKGANLSVGLLNGIVGDFLDKDNNGLAVQMQFYANEKPFTTERICKTILTTLLFIFVTIPVCIFRKTENNFLN